MKRIAYLCLGGLLLVGLSYGCGKKESTQDTTKEPTEVRQAEEMDTTAMDSAAADTSEAEAVSEDTTAGE